MAILCIPIIGTIHIAVRRICILLLLICQIHFIFMILLQLYWLKLSISKIFYH